MEHKLFVPGNLLPTPLSRPHPPLSLGAELFRPPKVTKSFARRRLQTLASPRLFLRLIPVPLDLCYDPLSAIARTEVDANEAMDMRVGSSVALFLR